MCKKVIDFRITLEVVLEHNMTIINLAVLCSPNLLFSLHKLLDKIHAGVLVNSNKLVKGLQWEKENSNLERSL
jgi:hypothetical protein